MDYFEEYERLTEELQINGGCDYNFAVGDILLDIDKSQSFSEDSRVFNDNAYAGDSQVYNDYEYAGDSRVFNDYGYAGDSRVFNSNEYAYAGDSRITENSGVSYDNSRKETVYGGGVTVNFNAYNEIHTSGGDVDAAMDSFGSKLCEIIASAVERNGI